MTIQAISMANFAYTRTNNLNSNVHTYKPSFKMSQDEFVSSTRKTTQTPASTIATDKILTDGNRIYESVQERIEEVDEILENFTSMHLTEFFDSEDGIVRDFLLGRETNLITEHNKDGEILSLITLDGKSNKVQSIVDYTDGIGELGRKIQYGKNWICVTPNYIKQEQGPNSYTENYVYTNGELLWHQQYFTDEKSTLMEQTTIFGDNKFMGQTIRPVC